MRLVKIENAFDRFYGNFTTVKTVKNLTINTPEQAYTAYLYEKEKASKYSFATERPVVKDKTLEEKVGSFVVVIDIERYANAIIERAQKLGLTVSGDGSCKTNRGVGDAKEGNILSFFGSSRFDVDWIADPAYSVKQNYVPVLTASKDFYSIIRKIEVAASEKKTLDKLVRPVDRTYREMKLVSVAKNDREALAKKNNNVIVPKATPTRTNRVVNYPHALQVGCNFYAKNPNDSIFIDVDYIW